VPLPTVKSPGLDAAEADEGHRASNADRAKDENSLVRFILMIVFGFIVLVLQS